MPIVELDLDPDQIAWMDARVVSGQAVSRSAVAHEAIMLGVRTEVARRCYAAAEQAVLAVTDEQAHALCRIDDDLELLRELFQLAVAQEERCMQPVAQSVPPTPTSTGVIEAIDLTGDTKIHWDKSKDAEVIAARASFDALKGKGYVAFRLGADGSTGAQMDSFDASAERILMMPQMRGG